MLDDRLFFQIAAALIPALLFGGLVSGVFRPSASPGDGGMPPIRSVWMVVLIGFPTTLALLAEIFAIDLATLSDSGFSFAFKSATVITVVTGLTAVAGVALVRPWIALLDTPHRGWVSVGVVIGAQLLAVATGLLLSASIAEAQDRTSDQQVTCVEVESNRRLRESRLDLFAASDAADARRAEKLQLADERVRLRYESGLSRSERRARDASLRRRLQHTKRRERHAGDNYRLALAISLDPLLAQAARGRSGEDIIERFVRALGC